MTTALALDLGSSSGRVLAGTLQGDRIEVTEVHRFKHRATEIDGAFQWDLEGLWENIVQGLRAGASQFPDAISISVDTWGVDYVALDVAGNQVGPAYAYRDERTARTLEAFRQRLSDEEFFALTGIAPATINTANQLFALVSEEPQLASQIDTILFSPDYWAWRLTGIKGWSRAICSTSGLCGPGSQDWCDEVFERLGLNPAWVGPLAADLTVVGQCQIEGLEHLTVVRGGAHDTACAVHALPIEQGKRAYFLSCGSWSVLGALEAEPLLGPAALAMGLTNESRTDGGIRPLFNLTGMWILQELQRAWDEAGPQPTDTDELVAAARQCPPPPGLIDPDDPAFAQPGAMVEKIDQALAAQGLEHPEHTVEARPQYVRLVIESFAARYARAIADLTAITGQAPDQLNLVGGGSRNHFLCDLTARAAQIPVVAGPVEASILGSLIAQLEIMGHLDPAQRPLVIAASAQTHVHLP